MTVTDCYICGHPVLEGQRTEKVVSDEVGMKMAYAHANPADHLPTVLPISDEQATGIAYRMGRGRNIKAGQKYRGIIQRIRRDES